MKNLKKQPVIVGLSAESYEDMKEKVEEYGLNNFVQKPANVENLKEFIIQI